MYEKNIVRLALIAIGLCLTSIGAFSDDEPWTPAMVKGQRAFDKGDYSMAIKFYTESIAESPDGPEVADVYYARAAAYNNMGRFSKSIADYSHSLKLQPDQSEAYYSRAHAYIGKGDYANAIADYKQAIAIGPLTQVGTVGVYNELAWLFATCPQAKFRDGKRAVENATAAWEASMKKSRNVLETLAAANAEAGNFPDAVKWEQEFLATPDLEKSNLTTAKYRLALYEAGKPYVDKS